MSGGSRWPAWFDPDDDRLARAAWSRLAEPGDEEAWGFVAEHGAGEALRLLADSGGRVRPRWWVRWAHTDPRRDLWVLERFGGRWIVPGDAQWPLRLDDLQQRRPFGLWVRGRLDLADACARSVAVVGARTATYYGRDLAAGIATGCADAGYTTVSGGAYGIDAAAHRAALAVDGVTVAVLACGIDRAYPRGNERLLEQIAEVGCLVSEVPPGSAPTRWRFLERNRLIAALTAGTVVVEAAWRSGAQNTARHALGLGRPLGACPGPVTSALSAGCHRLMREGAVCVCDAGEVLELVAPIGEQLALDPALTPTMLDALRPEQRRVFEALPVRRPASMDSIARHAGLEPRAVERVLARLAALDLAEQSGGRWLRGAGKPALQPSRAVGAR
jgi:DNA processing protein